MIGVFSGIFNKEGNQPPVYYFTDFSLFDKQTLSWGPKMDVIVKIGPGEFIPDIIWQAELKKLLPLERRDKENDDEE